MGHFFGGRILEAVENRREESWAQFRLEQMVGEDHLRIELDSPRIFEDLDLRDAACDLDHLGEERDSSPNFTLATSPCRMCPSKPDVQQVAKRLYHRPDSRRIFLSIFT